MRSQARRTFIAVGLTFILVTSLLISYALIFSHDPAAAGTNSDTTTPSGWMTADMPPPATLIKAGPTQGYEPLVVHFYANPANLSNISSYHWKFGPGGTIVPQQDYSAIFAKPYNKLFPLFFLLTFIAFFTILLNPVRGVTLYGAMFGIAFFSGIITEIFDARALKQHNAYESNLRDPSMVFVYHGSYSATLTITYINGTTATDTVWITVLLVPPPDYDNNSNHNNNALTRLLGLRR
jgi:hypothetical protein